MTKRIRVLPVEKGFIEVPPDVLKELKAIYDTGKKELRHKLDSKLKPYKRYKNIPSWLNDNEPVNALEYNGYIVIEKGE